MHIIRFFFSSDAYYKKYECGDAKKYIGLYIESNVKKGIFEWLFFHVNLILGGGCRLKVLSQHHAAVFD